MIKKRYVCMLAAFCAFFLLAGCQGEARFPVYPMEDLEGHREVLSIDGVQYQRDLAKYGDGQACYYSDDDHYVWTLARGRGEQIGVCGEGAEGGGGLAVYEVAGDEERRFLYTQPRKYSFGGVEGRLWMREDVSLGSPEAETVSAVTVVYGEEESASIQTDDPALIAALLEAYSGGGEQAEGPFLERDGWSGISLILHHKDYPFLQYRIKYRCHPVQGRAVFCQSDKRTWSALPEEWVGFLTDWQDVRQ